MGLGSAWARFIAARSWAGNGHGTLAMVEGEIGDNLFFISLLTCRVPRSAAELCVR